MSAFLNRKWFPQLMSKFCSPFMLALSASLSVCVPTAGVSQATDDPVNETELDFSVVDASISDVLQVLAQASGSRFEVSSEVRGSLAAGDYAGTLEAVLTGISQSNDLDWFKFNGVIYISTQSEAISRVVRLGNLSVEQVQAALEKSDLASPTLNQTVTPNGEAIVLTGPPKLVAFSEVIAESLVADVDVLPETPTKVRVRRGVEVQTETVAETQNSQNELATQSKGQ